MKQKLFFAALAILLFAGCSQNEMEQVQPPSDDERTLTFTAGVPQTGDPGTRTTLQRQDGFKNDVMVKWKATGDKINLYFVQDGAVAEVKDVPITDVSSDGTTGKFKASVPAAINTSKPYTLYGTHGLAVVVEDGKILADVTQRDATDLANFDIPLKFKTVITPAEPLSQVKFSNMGCFFATTLTNTSDVDRSFLTCLPSTTHNGTDYTVPELFYYATPKGTPSAPDPRYNSYSYDLITGNSYGLIIDDAPLPLQTVPAELTRTFMTWVMPKETIYYDSYRIALAYDDYEPFLLSAPRTPGISFGLSVGYSYNMFVEWSGNETEAPVWGIRPPTVKFTIDLSKGNTFKLATTSFPKDQEGVWIDLNNNGIRESGEDVPNSEEKTYTATSETVILYGKVDYLVSKENPNITGLQLFNESRLTYLYCYKNENLTNLDVAGITSLKNLLCTSNKSLTSLSVLHCTALEKMDCASNDNLTSLVMGGCYAMKDLYCAGNPKLASLSAANLVALEKLQCTGNEKLESLYVTKCKKLKELFCQENALNSLDVSTCTALETLKVWKNNIKMAEMTALINSLPDHAAHNPKIWKIYPSFFPPEKETNEVGKIHFEQALKKGWESYWHDGSGPVS